MARTKTEANGGARANQRTAPREPPRHDHVVQFYDAGEALLERAGAFLAGGLLSGAPAIVVASGQRQDGFRARFANMGVDVAGAVRSGQLAFLDAEATLAEIVDGDQPDEARFRRVVGKVFAGTIEVWHPARLRAYGELVDLLWERGSRDAALRLEELWNDLAHRLGFALHCAYATAHFHGDRDRAAFDAVCRNHGGIIAPEVDVSVVPLIS